MASEAAPLANLTVTPPVLAGAFRIALIVTVSPSLTLLTGPPWWPMRRALRDPAVGPSGNTMGVPSTEADQPLLRSAT